MMREARARGFKPECVLFDSWYAAATLLNLLAEFGWKYIARLKSNRLLDGVAVRERWRHRFGRRRGQLRKVTHEVLLVKDGRRYFVSNDVQLTAREVKTRYRVRQQIEEMFRLLKQEFGWGGSSAHKARAQVAHLHLGLIAQRGRARSHQSRADDLCVQAQLISSAHPGTSFAVRRL